MILTSKYNIGDVIYEIASRSHRMDVECPECNGKSANTSESWAKCQKCNNAGTVVKYSPRVWTPTQCVLTVGMIKCEVGYKDKVEYMCNETGIGSGRLYNEEEIYSSMNDAIAECYKRNKEGTELTASLHRTIDKILEGMR